MASQAAGDIGATKPESAAAPTPALVPAKTEAKPAVVEDVVDDAPDPDEDDLDDLDDMLDEFSAVKVDDKKAAVASGPGRPAAATASDEPKEDELSEEDFAKQLQAGMADLLGEIENSPEMAAQFESIFKELGAAAAGGAGGDAPTPPVASPPSTSTKGAPPSSSASASAEASFQETIRRTMERMQASGEQASAAVAAEAEGSDDFMAELLKQMQSGDFGAGGEGGEEEFSKMLVGMMEQLTHKEILYEPMKELDDKFPEWMEKNKDKVSADDLKRYQEQQKLVKEIVAKFEEPNYSDESKEHHEYIVDRMQKMQDAGSPPPDLVGDMPSAQDMSLPGMDESCNPQ